MKCTGEKGLTLVEVVIAVALMGIIAAGTTTLISSYLNTHSYATAKSGLYREGLMAMERMTDAVRSATYVLIPNSHNPTRDILAVSGFTNEDNDYYFGDTLFPKIDEDPRGEMNMDDTAGILGFDDDGDGLVDESIHGDDDEDTLEDEDPLNGEDDDGDGNVDEDVAHDSNNDGSPGIAQMDDNGDGQVDNGNTIVDDDEDGSRNEDNLNPVIYHRVGGTDILRVSNPYQASAVNLSSHVTSFLVTYEAPERILITMTLTGDDGETVTFTEYVNPRNTYQKIGKRVR